MTTEGHIDDKAIISAEDLAAPGGPDESVAEIKTNNRMKGVVRFSKASRYVAIGVIVTVVMVAAYGFGLFGTTKTAAAVATPPPLASVPKGAAVTSDGDSASMDDMLKNAPAGIDSRAHPGLPPLASMSLRGANTEPSPGSTGLSDAAKALNGNGDAPAGDDKLGDALNAASNTQSSTQLASTGEQTVPAPGPEATFDTTGPNLNDPNAPGAAPGATGASGGGAVPNPGNIDPAKPSYVEQARQQQAQQLLTERLANEVQAKKASFYVGTGNRGEAGAPTSADGSGSSTQDGLPTQGSSSGVRSLNASDDLDGGISPAASGLRGGSGYGAGSAGGAGGGSSSDGNSRLGFQGGQNARSAYIPETQQNPIGKYELWAGSIIPAQLDTGINTDLPGPVVAHVQKDVYDSKTGQSLVIPKGSRLIGRYNSVIGNGQIRVQVVWDRLIWPDGRFISLDGQIGTEPEGQAGLYADVQDHKGRLIGASLFTALLSAGTQILANSTSGGASGATTISNGAVVQQSVGSQLAQTGQAIIEKDANIPDELTVPKGKQFDVLLDRTMVLAPWTYEP
jgi:type IV secretory pathway VirB10-like protein